MIQQIHTGILNVLQHINVSMIAERCKILPRGTFTSKHTRKRRHGLMLSSIAGSTGETWRQFTLKKSYNSCTMTFNMTKNLSNTSSDSMIVHQKDHMNGLMQAIHSKDMTF